MDPPPPSYPLLNQNTQTQCLLCSLDTAPHTWQPPDTQRGNRDRQKGETVVESRITEEIEWVGGTEE